MKKLLGLLSAVTISGVCIPTVIAAGLYQKEEKIKNINYKREKRSNNKNNKTKIVIRTNGGISTGGIALNNKLYFGSQDKNVYEYDPATGQQKIVIKTNGRVWSSSVILNNKLYIGSHDNNVYEYDPITGQQKIVIKTNGKFFSSGVILNNKLYIGSTDNNVYEYDPITGQQKIVIKTNGKFSSSGVILNNKLYFGSGVILNNKLYIGSTDNNVYEYDPITGQQKIVIKTNGKFSSSGVIFNNKLYIGSWDHNVYEYDPITGQQKIIITTGGVVYSSGVVFNNKLYFGSDDTNVYEYDPITGQQKIIITTNGWIPSSGIILNNKLYFGSTDNNVYEYDPATEQQKIVITTNGQVWSLGIVFNNKLYFGSQDKNVYEYDPATGQQKIVITTNNKINSSGVFLNNKLYFGSDDGKVYEYNNNCYNLGQINDNSDNIILNELNYLNPNLDISQLEIVNKTNNLANIKEKINKYFDEFTVNYKIENRDEVISIDLNKLIKKAIFFKFRDENSTLIFKETKDINTNNLNFWNVEVTRNSELLYSVYFRNACFNKKTVTNFSSKYAQKYNIPKCEYNAKSKIIFQITKGLIKTKQENKLNGWNINFDDEIKLSDFISINNKDYEIINKLSNSFDLLNTDKQEQEIILHLFNEDENEISIDPKTRLKIKYSVREINLETVLNLKQKINGIITAIVITDDNEQQTITLSIKEAMQILQKYSLLPYEIIINEDNSITFNGKAKINLIQESEPKLITKIYNI